MKDKTQDSFYLKLKNAHSNEQVVDQLNTILEIVESTELGRSEKMDLILGLFDLEVEQP